MVEAMKEIMTINTAGIHPKMRVLVNGIAQFPVWMEATVGAQGARAINSPFSDMPALLTDSDDASTDSDDDDDDDVDDDDDDDDDVDDDDDDDDATTHTATPKPKCPWCQSSNFICEKNLVQHLASAIRKIGVPPSKTTSCRFSAVLHSEVMGKASGVGTQNEAEAFMRGFKKCFVSGELVGFNPQRCAAAAEYLADFVRQ